MSASAVQGLAAALRLLADRGFKPAGYVKGGGRRFKGSLPLSRGVQPVLLEIKDWEFLEYPCIQVQDGLANFPELRPHLNEVGDLCYFSRRSVVLDRYDPATAIAQCLEQAKTVLDKILHDANYVATDIQNELLVHWARQKPAALSVYMGSVGVSADHASLHFSQGGGAVLADDRATASALVEALNIGSLEQTSNRCWLFRTQRLPPIPEQFPKTVLELFEWLRDWDKRLYNSLQHVLTMPAAYEYVLLGLAFQTPAGWIGVLFNPHLGKDLTPIQNKTLLHKRGSSVELQRLSFNDVSPEFVHGRNLSFPDLSNRVVNLVGCGAIGSQLAPALVRLGAGQGRNGLLRLIDEELLEAENLGRHYLGYNRLGQKKAVALREELIRQFPLSRIESAFRSAQNDPMLFRGDMLIDATGDEPVSEHINASWLARGRPCPVLYIWIKGNGECVQSLLTDGKGCACFRCLRLNKPEVHRQERFPVLKRAPGRKVLGCHAFTPYAVTAPLQAAALAADVVCDWFQGKPSPRYRTRYRENVDVLLVENGDFSALPDCPACATS